MLHAAGASTDEIGELQLPILVNPEGGSSHGIITIILILFIVNLEGGKLFSWEIAAHIMINFVYEIAARGSGQPGRRKLFR